MGVSTSVLADRRFVRLIALLCLAGLIGCTPAGGAGSSGGNRIVTPAPASKPSGPQPTPSGVNPPAAAPTPTTNGTAPRLRGQGLTSAELYTAYRAILDTYVDPVDDARLIKAAADSLRQGLQAQASLPLITMPMQLVAGTTGNVDKDWQAFGDAYDSVV